MIKELNEKLVHPQKLYPNDKMPKQKLDPPGLQSEMNPVPDSGEDTYVGHGRLKGRRALITGGDSGIGRAIAIAFAREDADLAINYLPEEQLDADSLANLLRNEDHKIVLLPGDLKDDSTSESIIRRAHAELGGLDILVLNAGVQIAQTEIEALKMEQVRHTFDVNVFPLIAMSKAAIPLLPPGSSIIFTASAEFYAPNKMLVDYAASKFAVVGFAKALAKQVIDRGIRVNAVSPGPIWTPLEVAGGNPEDLVPEHGQDTPMKRPGQPVEMSGVYVFLASNESTYVTGELYGVTGGLS